MSDPDPAVARLRPFNLAAAGLHLVQGLAMLVLSNAIARPRASWPGRSSPTS